LHASRELLNGGSNGVDISFAAQGEGVRAGAVQLGEHRVKAVAVSGLQNAVSFLEAIRTGQNEYAFMELMACPQGCVSGGGQPKVLLPADKERVYAERAQHTSFNGELPFGNIAKHPAVQQLYQCYFAKPYGDKSNRTVHTQYVERRANP
jgi:iron only hydrogenase large subunit-like protein